MNQFVGLVDLDGDMVIVNLAYVTHVAEATTHDGSIVHLHNDNAFHVVESISSIVEIIAGVTS